MTGSTFRFPRRRHRSTRAAGSAFLSLAALVLLLQASHASAQTEEIIEVRTDLVTVPVIVTDRRNRLVTGLSAADFSIYDDDRPVQPALFTAGVERLALAFVLDASGSVREQIARQEQATRALLDRFSQKPRLAVFHFDTRPRLVVDFTTDADAARRAFSIDARPDRRTAIFDATLAAVRRFDSLPSRDLERRIVVLVSDGLDTASTIPPTAVVNEAVSRGVAIYVLHLSLYTPRDGRLAPRKPSPGFRDLATRTGGNYHLVGDARTALDPRQAYDFTPVFQDIAADLRSQYVIGYYPPMTTQASVSAPTEHRIRVELTPARRRGLRLRVLRQSYTLQPTTSRPG